MVTASKTSNSTQTAQTARCTCGCAAAQTDERGLCAACRMTACPYCADCGRHNPPPVDCGHR